MRHSQHYAWDVLLIGGTSGIGKTTIARQLGLQLGLPWLQVDDLRLALQWSRAILPQRTSDLYFFLDTPGVWQLTPERLCAGLIAVGEVMSPAIEVAVESHLATAAPIIIEGDGILPSLFARPALQQLIRSKQVQGIFLIEPEEEIIVANMIQRNREIVGRTEEEIHTEARSKWLYSQWLAKEAQRLQLPMLETRPWQSLSERILSISFS